MLVLLDKISAAPLHAFSRHPGYLPTAAYFTLLMCLHTKSELTEIPRGSVDFAAYNDSSDNPENYTSNGCPVTDSNCA